MKQAKQWLKKLQEKRKIKEQEKLIEALKRPENESRRRPAMKFANKTMITGPR